MDIRWKIRAACAATLALLAGCAIGPRVVRTEVTSFNELAELPSDRTYTFARTLEYRDSLEVRAYEGSVRDELAVQGFKLATDPAAARLIVTLRPSVSSVRVRNRDAWQADPFWSPFGGFYGRRGFGGYDSFGPFYGSPFYGGSFYNDFNDYDVYRHRLELDIDSKTVAGKRFYEGRAESSDETESISTAMPSLIRALFSDFPGNNGQTRRVDVPVERR